MLSLWVVLLAVTPARAGDMDFLEGNNAPAFTHSTGLYAFLPPGGWNCRQLPDSAAECRTSNGGAPAVLTISHLTVEGQLDSELMAINTEKALKKLPHYKRLGGGRLLLGGVKASIRSFTFDYQGNTEYPVAVEELYVVSGGKAVRLHFETMTSAMPTYSGELRKVYDTFAVGEVDALGQVVNPAQPRNLPGQKKKKGGPPPRFEP